MNFALQLNKNVYKIKTLKTKFQSAAVSLEITKKKSRAAASKRFFAPGSAYLANFSHFPN